VRAQTRKEADNVRSGIYNRQEKETREQIKKKRNKPYREAGGGEREGSTEAYRLVRIKIIKWV